MTETPPPKRERGVIEKGVRGGVMGFVGCLTFVVLLLILVYGCSQAAG